jgi:D-tyrosyl-tRNA(Tyr) deacylase
MKALLQRVTEARVDVAGDCVGQIGPGLLVFLGLERCDDESAADRMVKKLLAYRVFSDASGKMNLSVVDTAGSILLISQFTLAADTSSGLRPGFSTALAPEEANKLYSYTLEQLQKTHGSVEAGEFGADMQVSLTNDGPVTFLLEI